MKKFFDSLNPSVLFVSSVLCLPGILFQQSAAYLWIDLALFALLSALKKGRLRILPPLLICFSIVFFNLFKADGYVLFSIFSFRVTSGALLEGLKKSGVLLSMVFLSQYAVSRNLNLPGKAGAFLSLMFRYFDLLNEKTLKTGSVNIGSKKKDGVKRNIRPFKAIGESLSSFMKKTDERLLSAFFSITEETPADVHRIDNRAGKPARFVGILFSVLPLFPVYLLLILSRPDIFPV